MIGRWLRRLYDWVLHFAGHRHAGRALFFVSLAEASFFPIPPDVLLMAMCLSVPKKARRWAALATSGSLVGGLFGYLIGWQVWQWVGDAMMRWLGPIGMTQQNFDTVQLLYQKNAFWAVFTAGLTPIPYKVFTIAAGIFEIPLLVFFFAALIGRALRFFMVAELIARLGPPIQPFIERHLGWLTLLFAGLGLGGFLLIKGL